MNSDLIFYDQKGILPSPKAKTIDDFLSEADHKYRLLEQFKSNPHSLVEGDYSLEALDETNHYFFVQKFMTEPFPALVSGRETFKRLYSSDSFPKKLLYSRNILGSFFYLDRKKPFSVPIIVLQDKIEDRQEAVAHENIHVARSQWNTFYSKIKAGILEEAMAYTSHNLPEETTKKILPFGISYSLVESFSPLTLLAMGILGYTLFGPKGILYGATFEIFTSLLASGTLSLPILKTKNLMEKCQDEKINPHYLLLRSNPFEFTLRKPIEEQIAQKEGVKWDIIRTRLNIPKTELISRILT